LILQLLPVRLPERLSRFGCRPQERKIAAPISAVSDLEAAGFLVLGDLRDTRERERAGRSPSDSEAGAISGAEQSKQAG